MRGCTPPVYAAPDPVNQPSLVHDLRNLLASIGLHVETLQRLSGPGGAKAADAAYALLVRGTTLCNKALQPVGAAGSPARRRGVDLPQIARDVADLIRACAPKDFSFDIPRNGTGSVLADPDDVFRILFNLMNNAVAVANGWPGTLTTISVEVSSEDTYMTIRVSDDGPGLPAGVRTRLFVREFMQGEPVLPRPWPRHCARARGAKWRHAHADPFGQRHQLRIDASRPAVALVAGSVVWPSHSGGAPRRTPRGLASRN